MGVAGADQDRRERRAHQLLTIDYFTHVDYDPSTATLFHSAKGRGLADCGEAATWRFDGREFRLTSYAYLGRCSGPEPGNWPTSFRSADR